MNNDIIFLVIGGLILIILGFSYFGSFKSNDKNADKNALEHFGDYEMSLQYNYPTTIYETSLNTTFKDFKNLQCNILPISVKSKCLDTSGIPITRSLYPVHIIKVFDGSFLAVFNDGQIYYKTTFQDKFWNGPLDNSLPEDIYPLRMISLMADGSLLGVGFNNQLYKKTPIPSATLAQTNTPQGTVNPIFTTKWQSVPKSSGIIYILYNSAPSSTQTNISNDLLIAINTTGMLMYKLVNSMATASFTPLTNDAFKVLKIYFDKNGYMLGIGTDFKLYKKTTRDWQNSVFDTTSGGNPISVNDIMYDNDGKLFGLVIIPTLGLLELQKQNQVYYLSKFVPLELINVSSDTSSSASNNNVMTDLDVIKAKTGADISKQINVSDPLLADNIDVNAVSTLLKYESNGELRSFCKNKGYLNNANYENYELLNNLEVQASKISKLNNVINGLISTDPDKMKIQELSVS
jgi:hypothetical protein